MAQLNCSVKMTVRFARAIVIALVLIGCASPEERAKILAQQEAAQVKIQAQQEADRAQQEAVRRENLERAERVKQNWSQLREGLSMYEVEKLIGPIDAEAKSLMRNESAWSSAFAQQGSETRDIFTYRTDIYTLQFSAGKLKSWRLNK